MQDFKDHLRESFRLKDGIDYAIIQKYGETHLMCSQVFLTTILEQAEECGVTFHTIHTYKSS